MRIKNECETYITRCVLLIVRNSCAQHVFWKLRRMHVIVAWRTNIPGGVLRQDFPLSR